MEPQTLQDYKVLVRELNLKILKTEKINRDLEERLLNHHDDLPSDKKTVEIEGAIIMNNKVVQIARRWKGAHQRSMFRQLVRKIARTDFLSHKQMTTNPNLNVALIILTALQKRGLNFEMMFRMSDTRDKGEIRIQELGTLLKRLELERVSLAQINRFLNVLDEDCTGVINKENYYYYLEQNKVRTEINKKRSSSAAPENSFERDCLIKFAQVLKAREIKPQSVCSFCDLNRTGYVSVPQLIKFIKNSSAPFKDQEIEGIVTYLTRGNKNQKITQSHFIQEIERAMATPIQKKNLLATKSPNRDAEYQDDDEFDGDQDRPLTKKQVDPFFNTAAGKSRNQSSPDPKQSLSAKKNTFASPVNDDKENQRDAYITPLKKVNLKEKKRDLHQYNDEELRNFKRIIDKMEKKAKPIYQFLERLLLNVRDPAAGMTEQDFLRQLDKDYGEVLNREERQCLWKGIDKDASGAIDIFEVKRWFLSVTKQLQEKIVSTRLLLITMARSIETERIPTEEFVKKQGLNKNQICTLQDFHQKINSIFDFEEREVNELFMELDRRAVGTLEVDYFIETVDSFRGDRAAIIRPLSNTMSSENTQLLTRKKDETTTKQIKTPVVKTPERKKREAIEEREPRDETKIFKRAIVKMELEGRPVYQLLQSILEEMSDPNHGLDRSEVEDICQRELGGVLSNEELEVLVDKFDSKGDGIIAIDEVVRFLNANAFLTKEEVLTKELLLLTLAKISQAENLNTEVLLKQLGIPLNKRTTVIDLKARLGQIFKFSKLHGQELFQSFDHNSSGYISVADLIKGIDIYRVSFIQTKPRKTAVTSPVQEKMKSNTAPVILERTTPKKDEMMIMTSPAKDSMTMTITTTTVKKPFVLDPEKERLAKEARNVDDEMLEIFNKMCRSIKMEPLEFFDTAAEGDLECTTHAFRNTFTRSNLKATPQDLSNLIRLLDINNKGVIHLRDFEMVTMDHDAFEFLKQVEWEYEGEDDDVDEEVVRKVKEALADLGIEYIQFYKNCDKKGKKKISVLELKEGMRNTLPYSRISHRDSIKFMRSLDRNCTGMIPEDEFVSIMYKPEPPKNITRLVKDQSDPRAEIMNPQKLQSVAGQAKEGNNDLRDAIQLLKSVIYNPHIFSKPEGLFQKFDLNQDRILSREEFLKALDSIDSKANLSQRQKILLVTLADKYKNNKIEYEEFLKFLNQMNISSRQVPDKRPLAQTRYPASGIISYSPTKNH